MKLSVFFLYTNAVSKNFYLQKLSFNTLFFKLVILKNLNFWYGYPVLNFLFIFDSFNYVKIFFNSILKKFTYVNF
jgi:hypothetical protein